MYTQLLVNALIDFVTTALVLTALVITCAALIPPRPPRGPHH
jgi:multisubunit Na+/H+ antiporter MnhC subunit